MGQIYEKACNICIWLGPEKDNSNCLVAFINGLARVGNIEKMVKDPAMIGKWRAMEALMRRDWFMRRWVVQEVGLARKAGVYFGKKKLDWKTLSKAVDLYHSRSDEIAQLLYAITKLSDPKTMRRSELFHDSDTDHLSAYSLIHVLNNSIDRGPQGQIWRRLSSLETLMMTLSTLQFSILRMIPRLPIAV